MIVINIMQKHVDSVTSDAKISDVSRLIFGRGINGLPVVKGKKLVGFITERDILSQFYPSMSDFMQDPVHSANFEEMEAKISEILDMRVDKIMSNNPVSIPAETPILKAQSLMSVNEIGRLPVVDENNNLIGILTKGDIFRAVVGRQLPLDSEDNFYDWMSGYYDSFNDWKKRLSNELPEMVKLFKKEGVKTILDIGSSTGEHSIALAKEGFTVIGIDESKLMCRAAEKKRRQLPENIKKRVKFLEGKYKDVVHKLPKNIDVGLFMGNGLSHIMETDKNILEEVASMLNPKTGFFLLQSANIDKSFFDNSGFDEFLKREKTNGEKEAFLSFYTKNNELTLSRAVLSYMNGKWSLRGIYTKPVINFNKEMIVKAFKKIGFKKLSFYGSKEFGLFKESFNPKESEWLNVVAKR
jgi:CBS domain-containing protein/ubiquinone/menaquinone biosynthesis C-methylase UbiE